MIKHFFIGVFSHIFGLNRNTGFCVFSKILTHLSFISITSSAINHLYHQIEVFVYSSYSASECTQECYTLPLPLRHLYYGSLEGHFIRSASPFPFPHFDEKVGTTQGPHTPLWTWITIIHIVGHQVNSFDHHQGSAKVPVCPRSATVELCLQYTNATARWECKLHIGVLR